MLSVTYDDINVVGPHYFCYQSLWILSLQIISHCCGSLGVETFARHADDMASIPHMGIIWEARFGHY